MPETSARSVAARGVPRVLVVVTYGLSVRYLLPTGVLGRLAETLHVVVGVGWDDPELCDELGRRGLPSVRLPDAVLDHDYRRHRRRMDRVHQRRLRSPSTAIERRQRDALVTQPSARAMGAARRLRDDVLVRMPGAAARIEAAEASALDRGTNVREFERFLEECDVDLLLSVTPYHEQDSLLLEAAGRTGTASLTSVISFDNPTTRRRFPLTSDRLLVWNRFNKAELLRSYPGLAPEQVGVVGAPQFDLHGRAELLLDDSTWRNRMGLDPARPVILYGGGPSYLVPHEPRLVTTLDDLIDAGEITGSPQILVRRHPADDPRPWRDLAGALRNGVLAEPWAPGGTPDRGWPTEDDLVEQMSSLAHSAVHVNVCSSMTLDGAVLDRPQVGPLFVPGLDRRASRRVRDLYRREHWAPITASGGLVTARSPAELAAAVNSALRDPGARAAGRRRMVEDLLGSREGPAGDRLVREIVDAARHASRLSPTDDGAVERGAVERGAVERGAVG